MKRRARRTLKCAGKVERHLSDTSPEIRSVDSDINGVRFRRVALREIERERVKEAKREREFE